MNNSFTLPPQDVKKIAVVRANALGDFIFVLPALDALKQRFPDAEIVYLGNTWHKQFLEGRAGPVSRVEIIPICKGIPHESDTVQSEKEVNTFFQRMKEEKFDIAFQMHGGGGNSNPFTKQLGARLTVGLKTKEATPLDINIPYCLFRNEVLRYLEVVSAVGASAKNIEPAVQLTEKDMEELKKVFPDIQIPYVVIHPGASDLRRRWPAEKFAEVASELSKKGLDVFVTGSKAEAAIVTKIEGLVNAPIINACNKLNINGLTGLLAGASLVVSNDTGPLHLARALGTPTVGIYWNSNILLAGPIFSRLHRTCEEWSPSCPICNEDCSKIDASKAKGPCKHETSFVSNVEVREVLDHSLELLETRLKESELKEIQFH